ncbi:MAG TPA: ClpXP protease specificity-enhancing factor [Methylotenera sp.]|nr:ClpXP protease specificity-enhancing factor [Methylotenera sp.]
MADGLIPTKSYMVRAIHEWCVDNGFSPHLLVAVNAQCRLPVAYVKDGEIVLNLNYSATKDLHIDNDAIVFSARFGGVSQNLYVPMGAVKGIFARENGQGMFFEPAQEDITHVDYGDAISEPEAKEKTGETPAKKKPTLTIVK